MDFVLFKVLGFICIVVLLFLAFSFPITKLLFTLEAVLVLLEWGVYL